MSEFVVSVERTGNVYSIASSEFLVTFVDGTTMNVWSPPWNDMTPEEEEAGAVGYAEKQYLARGKEQ